MSIGSRKHLTNIPHQCEGIAELSIRIGGNDYAGIIALRPTTVTIYNQATSGTGWVAIATGLTNVMNWRLSEKDGKDFDYAFEAAPATFATAWGWVSNQTEITAIYARRKGSADINLQLEVWTP